MSGQSVTTDIEIGALVALTAATAGASAPVTAGLAVSLAAGTEIAQHNMKAPTPDLASPDSKSSTPTQAQANTTGLQTALAKEQQIAGSSGYLGLTGGLLDKPSTASRSLLGV